MSRKPMTFDLDRSPPTAAERATKPTPEVDRQQIGARIPTATYRQLKARAALDGVSVQSLVEKAIDQFLASQAR